MIKQVINGAQRRTVNADMSNADFLLLQAVLAGKSEEWQLQSSGGAVANGKTLNSIKLAVGKKGLTSRRSAGVFLPHIKPTKTLQDLQFAIVSNWDEDFESSVKCEYCTTFGASSKGV